MTAEGMITTHLDEEDLARVDELAQQKGVSRDEMLAAVVRSGLLACEHEAASPAT